MLSNIKDEADRVLFIGQMEKIEKIFRTQSLLPKDARIGPSVVLKLEELYQFLEREVVKYDEIIDFK